ncbi:MAG: transporter ATP-binding protein [Ignavibacteria bacterium]|nr:transporter ATP-binding protein [Ignavibacteria bacterium]
MANDDIFTMDNNNTNILIKKLRIFNYKSISDLTVENIGNFAVFAGPNGAGKTNFFDALRFVSDFFRFGIIEALKKHGGWENIHSQILRGNNSRKFIFEIEINFKFGENVNSIESSYNTIRYKLEIKNLHDFPKVFENLWFDNILQVRRIPNHNLTLQDYENNQIRTIEDIYNQGDVVEVFYPKEKTNFFRKEYFNSCIYWRDFIISNFFQNLQTLRIDPISAKTPSPFERDSSVLDEKAHNLSAVIMRLDKEQKIKETILEYMSLIVPQLENLHSKKEKYQNTNSLTFKERRTKKEFPAHLISDGTIYVLAMLVAILDKSPSKPRWLLIEEPERGLHPNAIVELVKLMREEAQKNVLQPIWLTTHNATLVRACNPEDLFFIENEEGSTIIKKPINLNDTTLTLDEAWLSNSLNGGLPW